MLGKDLNGKPGGNEGTGTVTVKIKDVNDNAPTLEKQEVAFLIQGILYMYSLVFALSRQQKNHSQVCVFVSVTSYYTPFLNLLCI